MISKRKINKRALKKTNNELVETISLAKKLKLSDLVRVLSGPTKNQKKVNLKDIANSDIDEVVIPGKVLSLGELKNPKKIYALSFSKKASEKLLKSKSEIKTILEALKSNPKLKINLLK